MFSFEGMYRSVTSFNQDAMWLFRASLLEIIEKKRSQISQLDCTDVFKCSHEFVLEDGRDTPREASFSLSNDAEKERDSIARVKGAGRVKEQSRAVVLCHPETRTTVRH